MEFIYTINNIAKQLGKDKSTVKRVADYLNLELENRYYDRARKNIDFYSEDSLNRIKTFIDSHDTKTFFREKTNLEKYGCKSTSQNEKIKEKRKQTCIEKYGADNPMKSEIIKNKVITNNIEKHGFAFPFQDSDIQNKSKETCIKKYGVSNYNQCKESKEKHIKTCLEKYGVENISQNEDIKKKKLDTMILKNAREEKEYNSTIVVNNLDLILNRDITSIYQIIDRLNIPTIKGNTRYYIEEEYLQKLIDYCKITDESGKSYKEKEILSFIKSIYNSGEILENDRKVISPYELDLYIPEKKIAIEFDGLYWHSSCHILRISKRLPTRKENQNLKKRHLLKTIECEKKGIRLIHIFEDEWDNKKGICKSIIASSLGIYQNKIYARKCEIKEIPLDEYKIFLHNNHIQDYTFATNRLGLYYNNELVQSIGITKSTHKNGDIELNRMVTKLNTQVLGGFSKLIKNACKKYGYDRVTSYVSRRMFNGNGYGAVGFKPIYTNSPTYFYVDSNLADKRFPRYTFMKSRIKDLYNRRKLTYWNENETEETIMAKNGYGRIYDCGTIKVEYKC